MLIKKWLSNDMKVTIVCVVFSIISLVLSIIKAVENLIKFDVAWIAIILCGIPIVIGAINALIKEHDIKADVLVSIALIASLTTKEYFAAGEVALIMQIGSLLEDFTADRAKKGIEKLIKLTPKVARVIRNDKEEIISVEEVSIGDVLRVIAGETIPVDGILLSGETSVNQGVMTGESIPVDKKRGDELISGSVNQYGTFDMKVTKICVDSSLQRMIRIAKEADCNKAPIVGLVDKWATWMVAIALLCSVVVGLISKEFMRAVTVLVVFCPCAFILATPTAVAATMGNVTKYGILIRRGDALERLAKVDYIAFDKTGTLTYGKPKVVGIESFKKELSKDKILELVAIAEKRSEHPLGKAIVESFMEKEVFIKEASNYEILPGKGIKVIYENKTIIVGKKDLFNEYKIDLSISREVEKYYFNIGATVIYLAVDNTLYGLIGLSDTIRKESKDMIKKLKNMDIKSILLTGDNLNSANYIASEVKVDEAKSNLMPEDKMNIIKQYNSENKKVCMIGDGVNDALALNTSYVGIAMGGIGSDIAVESSDVVLVSDDVKRVPYLLKISKKSMKKVEQNIIISLLINFISIILSGLGILVPVTAALVHNFGSVFVVVNAAMLFREKDIT